LPSDLTQGIVDKAIENMDIFAIGASWGGYESLIKQGHNEITRRNFLPSHKEGYLVRVYAGLENKEDLWADLEGMLAACS
jgi:cystathionine beta-lyase